MSMHRLYNIDWLIVIFYTMCIIDGLCKHTLHCTWLKKLIEAIVLLGELFYVLHPVVIVWNLIVFLLHSSVRTNYG